MDIIIYSTPICPRCLALKTACQKAQIAYEEKPLDASILARCLCETDIWVQEAPLVLNGVVWYFASDIFSSSGNLLSNWQAVLSGNKPEVKQFSGMASNEAKEQKCQKIWRD